MEIADMECTMFDIKFLISGVQYWAVDPNRS
jgi:hypothetical protein